MIVARSNPTRKFRVAANVLTIEPDRAERDFFRDQSRHRY